MAGKLTATERREPILECESPEAWHAWLRKNHAKSAGVLLRIAKKGAASSLTYAEALDAALAWGWIDSQKLSLDAAAFLQRMTPRKATSPWSKKNRERADAMIAEGLMEAPGLAEVDRARRNGAWERAYDGARTADVPEDLAAALARDKRAKAFFEALDRANRYAILWRVQTAKKAATRAERIARFVEMCAKHETIHPAGVSKSSPAKGPPKKASPKA